MLKRERTFAAIAAQPLSIFFPFEFTTSFSSHRHESPTLKSSVPVDSANQIQERMVTTFNARSLGEPCLEVT